MGWLNSLQDRWKVDSIRQVLLILLVFACTGCTVVFLKRPILKYLFADGDIPLVAYVVYYLLILPVYNIFLLVYGFIFGQFHFFWNFEKKFLSRIITFFKK